MLAWLDRGRDRCVGVGWTCTSCRSYCRRHVVGQALARWLRDEQQAQAVCIRRASYLGPALRALRRYVGVRRSATRCVMRQSIAFQRRAASPPQAKIVDRAVLASIGRQGILERVYANGLVGGRAMEMGSMWDPKKHPLVATRKALRADNSSTPAIVTCDWRPNNAVRFACTHMFKKRASWLRRV